MIIRSFKKKTKRRKVTHKKNPREHGFYQMILSIKPVAFPSSRLFPGFRASRCGSTPFEGGIPNQRLDGGTKPINNSLFDQEWVYKP